MIHGQHDSRAIRPDRGCRGMSNETRQSYDRSRGRIQTQHSASAAPKVQPGMVNGSMNSHIPGLGMILIATAIGFALHLELQFSPALSVGISVMSYIILSLVHRLIGYVLRLKTMESGLAVSRHGQHDEFPETFDLSALHLPRRQSPDGIDTAKKFENSGGDTARAAPAQYVRETKKVEGTEKKAEGTEKSEPASSTVAGQPPSQLSPGFKSEPESLSEPEPEPDLGMTSNAAPLHEAIPTGNVEEPATGESAPSEGLNPSKDIVNQIVSELSEIRPGYDAYADDTLMRELQAATLDLERSLAVEEDLAEDELDTNDFIRIESEAEGGKDASELPPERSPESLEGDPQVEQTGASDLSDLSGHTDASEQESETDRMAQADEMELHKIVSQAIAECRTQIYLQPILGLANRKAESFEVLAHLEYGQGEVLAPDQYTEEAERAGQMPVIDDAMLKRTIGVLRKLEATKSSGTMFCNLSIFSLSDDEVMTALIEILSQEQQIAGRLVIELSEQAYLACTPNDRVKLDALRDLGVRLSLDQIKDAGIYMDALRSRLFSFIKLDTAFFLDRLGAGESSLLPAEILSEASLAGVELIIDQIESDVELEQVIEFGAKFGQGYIFSRPRPVKQELLEDAA